MYRDGLALSVCVRICPVFYLLIFGWDLGLEDKAVPSLLGAIRSKTKKVGGKSTIEKSWGLGSGGAGGTGRVLLWQMKTIWCNHNE